MSKQANLWISHSRAVMIVGGLALSGTAWAIGGKCPSAYEDPGEQCLVVWLVGGVPHTHTDVCYVVNDPGGAGWKAAVCDVTWSSTPATVHMVSNFQTSSLVEAWGTVEGVDFCCPLNIGVNDTLVKAQIFGSPQGDTLKMRWRDPVAPNPLYWEDLVQNFVYGYDGNDIIDGSDRLAVSPKEELWGGPDVDTISGFDGPDFIDGEAGDDILSGGGDGDQMEGGLGHDTMTGGPGDDDMMGNAGVDLMSGGTGDDVMDGGTEGDLLCGGGQVTADSLDDGDGVAEGGVHDRLWGASAGDEDLCGAANTEWDGVAGAGTCGANPTLAAEPAGCP